MKINLKTNQWARVATVIQLIFLTGSMVVRISHLVLPHVTYYIFSPLMEFINFLLLLYIINILNFFREKKFIVIAFIIFTVLDVLRGVYAISSGRLFGFTFGIILGGLTFASIIYFFIASLKIKTSYVSFPYKLFSYGVLISSSLRSLINIIFPLIVDFRKMKYSGIILLNTTMGYVDILSLITPVSFLLIIKGVDIFIKDKNAQITGETSE